MTTTNAQRNSTFRRFVVIVAAGSGTRFGANIPKAFASIHGATLLAHSCRAVCGVPYLAGLALVVPDQWESKALAECAAVSPLVPLIARGGATRNASVRAGLEALSAKWDLLDDDIVAVHDAARCLVTSDIFMRCFDAAHRHGAATAAAPIRDTVKRVTDNQTVSSETITRDGLFAMQTPQVFRTALLRKALACSDADAATDEVSLVQRIAPVSVVPCSVSNFKVTFPEDIELAEALLSARSGSAIG